MATHSRRSLLLISATPYFFCVRTRVGNWTLQGEGVNKRNSETLYNCITGLVRRTGKYIARDDYTNVL